MRGLTMALLALDFLGNDANHRAGWIGVPFLSNAVSGKTKAKTITKTTGKTV